MRCPKIIVVEEMPVRRKKRNLSYSFYDLKFDLRCLLSWQFTAVNCTERCVHKVKKVIQNHFEDILSRQIRLLPAR